MGRSRDCIIFLFFILSSQAWGHDVPDHVQARLVDGSGWDFMVTGAEHMLTGYDHLLFLLGVVFFLRRTVDIVKFVTAFTLAHTLVLLTATLTGITADHYLIDAVIAASVMYKGFENLDGFERLLGFKAPPLLAMVFLFGLVHGFGLSAQLQTLTLADDPKLVSRLLWFSLGVELGQLLALALMVPVIAAWRNTRVWAPLSRSLNSCLVFIGFLLFLFQLHGYLHQHAEPHGHDTPHPLSTPADTTGGWHSHDGGPAHFH